MNEPTGLEMSTPVRITSTSATERAGFRKCRRSWFAQVVHRLSNEQDNVHFFLGTLYHSALEAYYRHIMKHGIASHDAASVVTIDTYVANFTTMRAGVLKNLGIAGQIGIPPFDEYGDLGLEMLQNYLAKEATDPLFDEVLAVEFRVNVGIFAPGAKRRSGILSVQADAVGMKDGVLAVADHKTASKVMPSAHLDLDDQLTAEVYAWWQATGAFPERAIYNVSMKKSVAPPRILKSGKLSKDKNQGTTATLYRQAIIEHGLNVADYLDILLHLDAVEASDEDPLFRRETVFRTPGQMATFERDLYHEWKDMKDVAAHPERAYPNPTSMNCGGCPVRIICTTMQDEGDVAAIIQAGYVIVDPRR